jgi:hypothetical protein
VQTSQKVSEVFEESRKGAEKKIKEKKIELEAFEIAELKGDNDLDLTIDEFEEDEDEEVPLKFEKRKLVKDEIEDSEDFTGVECPFCAELFDDLRAHLPNCEFAPEDASIDDILPSRTRKKKKSSSSPAKDTKGKQVCPYCGKEFVRIGRHLTSCPKKPEDADEKEKKKKGKEEEDEEVDDEEDDEEEDEEEDDEEEDEEDDY